MSQGCHKRKSDLRPSLFIFALERDASQAAASADERHHGHSTTILFSNSRPILTFAPPSPKDSSLAPCAILRSRSSPIGRPSHASQPAGGAHELDRMVLCHLEIDEVGRVDYL